jgi:hypothetical protein
MVAAATVDASTALVIMLRCARQANAYVVHVQHDGGPGHLLAKGSIGWPHRPEVAPAEGEITIEKHHSSAFHNTDLHDRLSRIGIRRLMVAGIQTERDVWVRVRQATVTRQAPRPCPRTDPRALCVTQPRARSASSSDGKRPVAFLEKPSLPSTLISNTPPPDLSSVTCASGWAFMIRSRTPRARGS